MHRPLAACLMVFEPVRKTQRGYLSQTLAPLLITYPWREGFRGNALASREQEDKRPRRLDYFETCLAKIQMSWWVEKRQLGQWSTLPPFSPLISRSASRVMSHGRAGHIGRCTWPNGKHRIPSRPQSTPAGDTVKLLCKSRRAGSTRCRGILAEVTVRWRFETGAAHRGGSTSQAPFVA